MSATLPLSKSSVRNPPSVTPYPPSPVSPFCASKCPIPGGVQLNQLETSDFETWTPTRNLEVFNAPSTTMRGKIMRGLDLGTKLKYISGLCLMAA